MFAIHEVQEPTITKREALAHRDLALLLYKERRVRDAFFKDGGDFWGEPAWDMLLDIFIANETGRLVNVTSACIGGDVPTATGLRHVGRLLEKGFLHRTTDPKDRRRGMLGLTDGTTAAMRRYLDETVRNRLPA